MRLYIPNFKNFMALVIAVAVSGLITAQLLTSPDWPIINFLWPVLAFPVIIFREWWLGFISLLLAGWVGALALGFFGPPPGGVILFFLGLQLLGPAALSMILYMPFRWWAEDL